MKNSLAATFFLLLAFMVLIHFKPSYVQGQSCSGSVSCGSRVNVVCQPANCTPGTPGCNCRDECAGLTVPASCSGYGGSIAQCNASAICEIYNARCLKSGSCEYNPPASTQPSTGPSSPPQTNPPGGSCSGQCIGPVWEGIAMENCGTIGKAPASGSCSGGAFCCSDGGGGDDQVCELYNVTPREVRVGEIVEVSVTGYNDRSSWRDSSLSVKDIDVGPQNIMNVNSDYSSAQAALANPLYIQPSEIGKNICCNAGGASPYGDRDFKLYFTGKRPGTDLIRLEYEITEVGEGDAVQTCPINITFRVTSPPAWTQISDGDLITFDRINIPIPPSQFLLSSDSSDEGIMTFNPLYNLGAGQISSRNWNARLTSRPASLQYQTLLEQIPSTVSVTTILSSITNSSVSTTPRQTDVQGFEWFRSYGDTVVTGNITIPDGRKIVIFVDGNVRINGSIRLANPSNSFFMIASANTITVAGSVGSSVSDITSDIDGVYFAANQFVTEPGAGPANSRLNINGTVVAINGVSLQRDTLSESPSEVFTFNPDLFINFPPSLGIRRAFWKEVAP